MPLPDGTTRAVYSLILYADFANLFGAARAAEGFAPGLRGFIPPAIESRCVYELALLFQVPSPGYVPPANLAELVDPGLRAALVACARGEPGCTPDADAVLARSRASVPRFGAGPPILIIAGDADTRATPNSLACLRDLLAEQGNPPQACGVAGADHAGVVPQRMAFAIDWVESVLGGGGRAPCPAGPSLPDCELLP
jgi:hypothetical protein